MNVVMKVAGVDTEILQDIVMTAYRKNGWNTTATARHFGISRRALLRLVRRLKLRKKINEARSSV